MYYIIYKMANRANFRINPANALGIEADETRSKLIALALSKPENYYKLRDTAIGAITKNLAVTIYDMYFDILTEGLIPQHADAENPPLGFKDADGARYQLCYPQVDGSPYSNEDFKPKIPEKEVNIICSKISDQIRQIAKNIIEEIMPMNHLEMAQKKQVDILKARGI
jgi:hypothetical protein